MRYETVQYTGQMHFDILIWNVAFEMLHNSHATGMNEQQQWSEQVNCEKSDCYLKEGDAGIIMTFNGSSNVLIILSVFCRNFETGTHAHVWANDNSHVVYQVEHFQNWFKSLWEFGAMKLFTKFKNNYVHVFGCTSVCAAMQCATNGRPKTDALVWFSILFNIMARCLKCRHP